MRTATRRTPSLSTNASKHIETNPIQKSKSTKKSKRNYKYIVQTVAVLALITLSIIGYLTSFYKNHSEEEVDPRVTCKIPISKVNDDYCDCQDGSDEYLTSACSHLPSVRFLCENKGYLPSLLHTSKVDDGICDCCDGSDEHKIVCGNNCFESGKGLRADLLSKIKLVKAGAVIREQRVQQAASAFHNDDYGLNNEYYSLANKCLTHQSKEYTYEVCMFKHVSQKDRHGHATSLGSFMKWADDWKVQKYEAGTVCPGGPARTTSVIVECTDRDVDEIVRVEEPSRCTYEITVKTPSACSPRVLKPLEEDLKQLSL